MVLAVIVGIGSNYFTQFTTALQGQEPDIGQAMSLVLASLALFGLGIFGPGIASGLVAGAPQLGQAQRSATALGAGGMYLGGAGAAGLLAVWPRPDRRSACRHRDGFGGIDGLCARTGRRRLKSVGAGSAAWRAPAAGAARSRMSAALVLARPPSPAAGRVQRHGRT
jgi:type IV secretion system protein TrbL